MFWDEVTGDMIEIVTQALLLALFIYDRATGILYWRVNRGARARAGDEAGTLRADGYRIVKIGYKLYYAHRIIWCMEMGHWPEHEIDHINGVKDDNRWSNLREATRSQNGRNSKTPKTNTSGYKGVSWYKQKGKYRAKIKHNGKPIHLGYFDTAEAASRAYQRAARKYHGEFRRTS